MRSSWFLVLPALLYVAVVASHLSVAYIDFGDGNYLYISRRVADGAVLYRDILAPQPPCHLLIGSVLIRLGRVFGPAVEHELYTVRAFSILLHLLTMLVVWRLGLRLFRNESAGIWAAVLYLTIPVGFWWTLGYQSEPLEMFFLLGSFLLVLRWTRRPMAGAGLLGVLAICTNMTAVCYVGWMGLYLLIRDRRRALWYILPVIAGTGAVVGLGELLSGGHYLENVFFNQVGTFPHPDLYGTPEDVPYRGIRTIIHYASTKIVREGWDILVHEWPFIAASIAGIVLYLLGGRGEAGTHGPARTDADWHKGRTGPDGGADTTLEGQTSAADPAAASPSPKSQIPNPKYERGFVGWYFFWSLMSIGFVAKGATEDYIFTIGEPFVCLFAGFAVARLLGWAFGTLKANEAVSSWHPPVVRTLIVTTLALCFIPPALWIDLVVRRQGMYELDSRKVRGVRHYVEQNSVPGDRILGAPYYAYISRRNLIEDFSELFIWQIKYGLEQRVEKTTGTATLKVNAIAGALREKSIPVALINIRRESMQLFAIGPIRDAIVENYRPLLRQPIRTLNTDIHILVPARGAAGGE